MKSPLIAALSAGAALSVMAAGATFAQAPAAQPPAAAQKAPGMKRQHDPAAQAQRLRDTLKLTPAQEPALQAFLAAREQRRAERRDHRGDRQAMANLTTPQRLDLMGQRMIERQQAFAQHAEVVKRFYAQLTPEQQKAFDAMRQGRGGMGKHGRHGGHHGGERGAPPQG